jgi:hypothetical protein
MAEPLLDLGDVGVVEQGIGAGGGAERMGAEHLDGTEADLAELGDHDLVDAVGGHRLVDLTGCKCCGSV